MTAPSIMLIGHGQMGRNHLNNLRTLSERGTLSIASVVDTDERKLASLPAHWAYTDLQEAYAATQPDAILECSNTASHKQNLERILALGNTFHRPALFIEKPIVENTQDAEHLLRELQNAGYGTNHPVACAYLLRFSPATEAAISAINEHGLRIEEIRVQWQKNRKPTRPSPGVHIDETTHAIDTALSYILPAVGQKPRTITLTRADATRGDTFIDKEAQQNLYAGTPDKLTPIGELQYRFDVDGMAVSGLSSFMRGPKERNITLYTNKGPLKIIFDKDNTDQLDSDIDGIGSTVYDMTKLHRGRVYAEWNAFLNYVKTGIRSHALAGLEDAVFDANVSDAFDSRHIRASLPYKIQ